LRELLIFDPSVVVGCVCVVLIAWRWFAIPGDARRSEYVLLIAIFALVADPVAQAVADSLTWVQPMKMDLYAYAADRTLGQPSFVLGRMVAPHVWLQVLLEIAYGLAPIGVILALSGSILRRSAEVGTMIWAFVLNLLAAPVFYLLAPVSGPRFAFSNFPLDPGAIVPHLMRIDAAPNGIPSVHMSTALLIVWCCREHRWWATAAIVYLVLTIVSTLASGQHYGVDILAAVPYSAGVVWLSKAVSWRVRVPRREPVPG
jgi:PAP2 superfamily